MAKQIIIHKFKDKITLSKFDGEKIADIIIAKSSRTASVNLSIAADLDIKITKSQCNQNFNRRH